MFWIEEKLEKRINELSEYRYRDKKVIPCFRCQIDNKQEIGAYPPVDGEWGKMQVGECWEGRDMYIWLAADVNIPEAWKGHQIVGRFDFGITGANNNSGFESLLYVNGKPYQGVDSNHREVFFPDESTDSTIELFFRLWSGLEGGGPPTVQRHKIKTAEVAWLDEATDDLYFTAKAVLETVNILEANRTERIDLLSALERAFKYIDWSRAGSEKFYNTVAQASESLWTEISKLEKNYDVTIHCVGHTHIDVAWLWRLKHTREKAARSFSTVCRLMEKYPEYMFLQTQPQLYEDIKNDYPEIYEQICMRVKEGRWEAEGGMWLEADCNIPSGEALVRQLLYGTQFFREEFGIKCTYLWLPDVFGYNWAMPQILKKSGLDTFVTTKISWNQYNRMPHDTFMWRGIDGSEILTHFITTPSNGRNDHAPHYTYNGDIKSSTVQGSWDIYSDKNINRELLMAYGYGDGGGGVNREMLEMRRRLDKLPGIPHVKTGHANEYFKELHERVEATDQYVHTWDGELYLEYHRGTYTSQAYNKMMNRKLELLYRELEFIAVLNSMVKTEWSTYPKVELDEGWKIILRNQFHDIIPGSSISEVYQDSKEEYERAEKIAKVCWNEQASTMVMPDTAKNNLTVFNSASWQQTDMLYVCGQYDMQNGKFVDANGNELNAQYTEDGWMVQVENIPPMGFKTISFEPNKSEILQGIPFTITSSGINTPYYEIEWDDQGHLVKIYDIEAEREVLATGEKGNVLQVFEDKPRDYDAWELEIDYQEKMQEIVDVIKIEVKEIGTLRAVVRFEWRYMDSVIKQDMIVYKNNKRIDFKTEIEWKEHDKFMKAAFPVNIRSTEATYDIQFGNIKRPTHWNTSWDYAKFEVVGHQWADLSERGYGISLLNDCKYGYDIKDHVMRLSLIKSATYPDPEADQGRHVFTYSVYPHLGDWVQAKTVHEAWALNNPLTYVTGQSLYSNFTLFSVSKDNVMIDAVKKGEEQNIIVLRLHEFTGCREKINIISDLPIKSWQECNLMEQKIGEKYMEQEILFSIKPYEIKTFMIEMGSKSI